MLMYFKNDRLYINIYNYHTIVFINEMVKEFEFKQKTETVDKKHRFYNVLDMHTFPFATKSNLFPMLRYISIDEDGNYYLTICNYYASEFWHHIYDNNECFKLFSNGLLTIISIYSQIHYQPHTVSEAKKLHLCMLNEDVDKNLIGIPLDPFTAHKVFLLTQEVPTIEDRRNPDNVVYSDYSSYGVCFCNPGVKRAVSLLTELSDSNIVVKE